MIAVLGLVDHEFHYYPPQVGSIKRLVPRLKSLAFKERFDEMVQDVKPVRAPFLFTCGLPLTSYLSVSFLTFIHFTLIALMVPRLLCVHFIFLTSSYLRLEQSIVAATAACNEVKSSKSFHKLLELILLIGNVMNSGSKNGESVGFEISFLPKVCLPCFRLLSCLLEL
jgi:hypothetical protein